MWGLQNQLVYLPLQQSERAQIQMTISLCCYVKGTSWLWQIQNAFCNCNFSAYTWTRYYMTRFFFNVLGKKKSSFTYLYLFIM